MPCSGSEEMGAWRTVIPLPPSSLLPPTSYLLLPPSSFLLPLPPSSFLLPPASCLLGPSKHPKSALSCPRHTSPTKILRQSYENATTEYGLPVLILGGGRGGGGGERAEGAKYRLMRPIPPLYCN